MHRLVYVSTAIDSLTTADVDDIVSTAQRFNATRDITGVLLFNGLNFMQVLEGSHSDVDDVYSRIIVDPRHVSVVTVLQEPAETRIFEDWSMMHRNTRASARRQAREADDLSDILSREMPTHVHSLLANFDTLKGV